LGVQGNARLAASHACVSVHSINLASERALLLWTMHRKLLTYLSGFTSTTALSLHNRYFTCHTVQCSWSLLG